METSVRKNFVFPRSVARHLEEIAEETNQSMTAMILEMIEERYMQIKLKKRREALEKMRGSATGMLSDFSMQSVKADKDV